MRIEQSVVVDAPLDEVWALVNDVPRVAPCMPGAALTKVVDEKTYEGTVTVKLGPIRMSYKGTVVLEEVDEARHSAKMAASGRDVRGAGTARASVETRLAAESDTRTRLDVVSDLQLTGKVASFGRGAIGDVANKLFGQFASCLRDSLNEPEGAEPAAPAGSDGLEAGSLIGTVVTGRARAVADSVGGLLRRKPREEEERREGS
jgi:carbon monoxide dehydrogenase subunit G